MAKIQKAKDRIRSITAPETIEAAVQANADKMKGMVEGALK